MDLETVIGSVVNTSVRVGALYVPARNIAASLHRFVDPALIHANMEYPFEFTKSGSATKVKYKDRFFALLTEHQFSNQSYNPSDFLILNPGTRLLCTASAYYFQTRSDDKAIDQDLLIFDFTECVEAGDLPKYFWYNICEDSAAHKKFMPNKLICIGYPGAVNNIDFDAPRYDAKAVSIHGNPTRSSVRQRVSFVPDSVPSFEPKGMSGGGVFALSVQNREAVIYFAGMLTNATEHMFNFLSVTRICAALDRVVCGSNQDFVTDTPFSSR